MQGDVETLQSQVKALTPEPGDRLMTIKHPYPAVTCAGWSTLSPNDIVKKSRAGIAAVMQQPQLYADQYDMIMFCRLPLRPIIRRGLRFTAQP